MLNLVGLYAAVGIHEAVNVREGILLNILVAVAVCECHEGIELHADGIVPFLFLVEVEHPALRVALHF